MVIRDLFLKVGANDDVIQYGRRACAVRGARVARVLLLGTKFREHTKFVGSIGLAINNSVNCILIRRKLRKSDFIKKIINLNYYFSSRHVRKNPSVSSSSQYTLWF